MKPSFNPFLEYQSNEVNTADPRELVVMLYDGAIRFLEESMKHMESFRTYDKANASMLRAQDIITELMVSLDLDKGGEIAQNLLSLYSYMKSELLSANMAKDASKIKPIVKLLRELKTAWEQLDASAARPAPSIPVSGGFVAHG